MKKVLSIFAAALFTVAVSNAVFAEDKAPAADATAPAAADAAAPAAADAAAPAVEGEKKDEKADEKAAKMEEKADEAETKDGEKAEK